MIYTFFFVFFLFFLLSLQLVHCKKKNKHRFDFYYSDCKIWKIHKWVPGIFFLWRHNFMIYLNCSLGRWKYKFEKLLSNFNTEKICTFITEMYRYFLLWNSSNLWLYRTKYALVIAYSFCFTNKEIDC